MRYQIGRASSRLIPHGLPPLRSVRLHAYGFFQTPYGSHDLCRLALALVLQSAPDASTVLVSFVRVPGLDLRSQTLTSDLLAHASHTRLRRPLAPRRSPRIGRYPGKPFATPGRD